MSLYVRRPPSYSHVHDGHCAGGWLGGNSNQANVAACSAQCRATAGCRYFAFCQGPTGCDGATNCALYNEEAGCPDDDNWGAYEAYVNHGAARDGCAPLLRDYQLENLQNAPAQPALSSGNFAIIKAVYKSGRIMCDRNRNSQNMWQTCCNNGYSDGCGASFELIHNGNTIIQQPSWHRSAPQCAQPDGPTGDVVCEQAMTVSAGDPLIVTWSETRRRASLGDNEVDLVVDLFGCTASGGHA